MKKGSFIGINFGTTNTAVVELFSDEEGCRIARLGEEGEYPFSSVVAIPRNRDSSTSLKFGREVRDRREELSSTHDIFTSMKEYLGTDHEFVVGSNSYSAVEITAEFLKYVREYIESRYEIVIDGAGFSYPVSFSAEARRDLKLAATRAGIEVKCLVSEPTAAYFANRKEGQIFSRVMVLDWGGGTFDVSVLNIKKNSVTETALFGEKVGGDDIDKDLARKLHGVIVRKSQGAGQIQFDDMRPIDRDNLISNCERGKIEYSEDDEENVIHMMNYGDYGPVAADITKEIFDGIVESIIRNRILTAINTALGRAGLKPDSIDAVLIVGGSSNLRLYENAIMNIFKNSEIIVPKEPQWSTAEGAALMQVIGGNFKISNSVGLFLSDGEFFPVLEGDKHGVGSKIGPLSFSITDDVQDAHFNFGNENGLIFKRATVPTKGYLNEIISLDAEVDEDQIARIRLQNKSMGIFKANQPVDVEISDLTFHYDISELE